MSNIHGTPIDIVESEFPCQLQRFELISDFGGAGKHRGGMSFRREYEVLAPATLVYCQVRPARTERWLRRAKNVALTLHPGTARAQIMPSSCRLELVPGDTFEIRAATGGGFGPPHERDLAALRDDVENGYVSSKGLVPTTAGA